jgi:putative FmdB family regulatory protein
MPSYDYRCSCCGAVAAEFVTSISALDRVLASCDACGAPSVRIMTGTHKFTYKPGHFFEPYMDDRLDKKPILIRSQEHFRQECEKRNMNMGKALPDKLR